MREAKSIMLKSSNMVYKLLVVGIIVLFCGISIQPCNAIVQNNERLESNTAPNGLKDVKQLAKMTINFGEEIYNDKIEHISGGGHPLGRYYIQVLINFSCPSNRKLYIHYHYDARLIDWFHPFYDIVFCDKSRYVTIINGSNPPEINETYDKQLDEHYYWVMELHISATLIVYEYINGYWRQIDDDSTNKEVRDVIWFIDSRHTERIRILKIIFYKHSSLEALLRIMNLLR